MSLVKLLERSSPGVAFSTQEMFGFLIVWEDSQGINYLVLILEVSLPLGYFAWDK